MTRPTLTGARVVLREPRPEDRADRLAAGRDPEFRRMVGGAGPDPGAFTGDDAARWYESLVREPHAWVIELEQHCIGTALLREVDPGCRSARYSIGLFRPEHRGRGLGQEATRLVLDHAFGPLGLACVQLRVLDFNHRAIACYRRCGFADVAREPVRLGDVDAVDVIMEAQAPDPAGPVEIRGARLTDAAEMARLACELGYPASAEAMTDRLAALLPDPGQHIAVAPDGARLLGWIHVQRGLTLDIGTRAEIAGLVVDATARRHGLGRRLVAAAEDWTRAQGLSSLMVRSNVARDVSHPFYESIGFTRLKTQHVYTKRLDR